MNGPGVKANDGPNKMDLILGFKNSIELEVVRPHKLPSFTGERGGKGKVVESY